MLLSRFPFRLTLLSLAGLLAMGLAGCGTGGIETEAKYPTGADRSATGDDNIYADAPSIFGDGGLTLFDRSKKKSDDVAGIGVNSYLWRASLDTVSFMPLASADPFGGVIITDWYSPSSAPDERFKVNVFIMDKQLRSNGVKVKIFRQLRTGSGWADAQADASAASKLEEAILTRARQMRVTQMDN